MGKMLFMLGELNVVSVTIRLILAMILGGLLGLEREQKRRPAGLRTYMSVCVGSTLAMMTNIYLAQVSGADSSRIAAQVISGIGFLGAGTILVTQHNRIRGLTTAAGLWVSATIGLALGCGFYSGAIGGFIALIFALRILALVDHKIKKSASILYLYVEINSIDNISKVLGYAREHNMQVTDLEIIKLKENQDKTGLDFGLELKKHHITHEELISQFSQIDGVEFIQELE